MVNVGDCFRVQPEHLRVRCRLDFKPFGDWFDAIIDNEDFWRRGLYLRKDKHHYIECSSLCERNAYQLPRAAAKIAASASASPIGMLALSPPATLSAQCARTRSRA